MKRILVFSFLPLIVLALEKVNLIKDAGFEKNSGVWDSYVGRTVTGRPPAATASSHDSEKANTGSYSASCDTRNAPQNLQLIDGDSAIVIQGFYSKKQVSDLDSLILYYSVFPHNNTFGEAMYAYAGFYLNASTPGSLTASYVLYAQGLSLSSIYPNMIIEKMLFQVDTNWHLLAKDARKGIESLGYSSAVVDSFILAGWGQNIGIWRGQKIYWDDIRLTGYADYDVGLKGILSGDSVWKNTGYTPTARIKNFGRKPADSFLVIAQIEGGSGVVYADTLTWSLAADTEDTLSFKEFKPTDASNYTLTVSTFMTPDESDEDDVMSKPLYGSGVEEQPIPAGLTFEISSFTTSPRVSYSIPAGQQGTISLYDPTGRKVESLKVVGSGSVAMRSELASGIYFVKLKTSQTTITRKTVVIR